MILYLVLVVHLMNICSILVCCARTVVVVFLLQNVCVDWTQSLLAYFALNIYRVYRLPSSSAGSASSVSSMSMRGGCDIVVGGGRMVVFLVTFIRFWSRPRRRVTRVGDQGVRGPDTRGEETSTVVNTVAVSKAKGDAIVILVAVSWCVYEIQRPELR